MVALLFPAARTCIVSAKFAKFVGLASSDGKISLLVVAAGKNFEIPAVITKNLPRDVVLGKNWIDSAAASWDDKAITIAAVITAFADFPPEACFPAIFGPRTSLPVARPEFDLVLPECPSQAHPDDA